MLRGINDSEQVAHELGKLLQGKPALVNLIPYNPTDVTQVNPRLPPILHDPHILLLFAIPSHF